jgi:2-dehydro-3-deoxyphosphogalactonate aldolase
MTTVLEAHLPLIAILRGVTPAEVGAQVQTLVAAGFGLIEIPCNSPQWQRSVATAIEAAAGQAMIGAGTVLSCDDVDALIATGATLMVTPNTDPPLIRRAVAAGLVCAAGFATPTEGFAACAAGAQALKLFPAAAFGPSYVRSIKAVLPRHIPIFAVGGISPTNLADYLEAGCTGAGLGSDLYKPGQTPGETGERAQAFVGAYKRYAS